MFIAGIILGIGIGLTLSGIFETCGRNKKYNEISEKAKKVIEEYEKKYGKIKNTNST